MSHGSTGYSLARMRAAAVGVDDVVRHLQSGDRVFVHGACATHTPLLDALTLRGDVEDVQLYHLHLNGPCGFAGGGNKGVFSNSLFTGPALRGPIEQGRAEFLPVFL